MNDMNVEENRLQTFSSSWPSNAPVDPERLARGGFFATGNYLETECNWCHKKISDWQYGDQTMIRHRRLDPLCPFILNPTDSGNICVPNASTSSPVFETTATSSPQAHLDLKNELCRLATFRHWPNENISPQSLAKAGFYYLHEADQVRCAWCKGVIAEWEKDDNAFEEHQRFFPDCPRVKLGPLIEICSDGIRDLGIQQICPPSRPKYSSLDARLRTYDRWPINEIQKPEVLSEAGFYYQQIDDQVRCFHCNGGLRSWEKDDDPWSEHAKWFPHCQFVKLVKGSTYVTQVQGQEGRTTCRKNRVMSLDEAMSTEPVGQALSMGLNEGLIRYMTLMRLSLFGKPYESTEELVESVLEAQAENVVDDDIERGTSTLTRILDTILNSEIDNYSIRNEMDSDVSIDADNNERSSSSSNRCRILPDSFPANVPEINLLKTPTEQKNSPTCAANSSVMQESQSDNTTAPCSTLTLPNKTKAGSNASISLEEENRKLKDARLCKICMDDEVSVVFLPCGHLVTCVQCAPGVTNCPLCRSTIKGFVRTFLP